MRSRAVRRDLACWLSMALAPPPSRIFSSSLRTWATRSARARMLDSKRSELGSTLVGRTLLIVRAVESIRSGMWAEFGTTSKQLTIPAGRRRARAIRNAAILNTGRGKRRALQSRNVAEARIPARLADCYAGNRGVAPILYGDGSPIHGLSASGSCVDSPACALREFADAARSSLRIAWNLGALRYALVLAYRGARLRPAHGGDLLSVVSGGDSAREWVDASDSGGASGLDRGGILFFLGPVAPGRRRIVGGGKTPHAAVGLRVADQFRAVRGLRRILDSGTGGVGDRLCAGICAGIWA